MFVVHSMRLNKFADRPVPSPMSLYRTYGYSEPKYQSNQTAESMEITVPTAARKTQLLALAAEKVAKAAEFASDPSGTTPLKREQPKDK